MTRIARWLRTIADRIDPDGAPRCTGWSFTFEQGQGIDFHRDRRGCPVWYLGMADYDRAHAEARTAAHCRAQSVVGLPGSPGWIPTERDMAGVSERCRPTPQPPPPARR